MTQGIFWWNAGEVGPAIHEWPTEADSGEGFDFVLQQIEEQDGVAVMEDIVGALDIQGFWVGFTDGSATIVIDLARLANHGILLAKANALRTISEGLNTITDNVKEWTPEQTMKHAQDLRVLSDVLQQGITPLPIKKPEVTEAEILNHRGGMADTSEVRS